MAKLILKIEGMSCPRCARRIEEALRGLPGVLDASISYGEGRGVVLYDGSKASPSSILGSAIFTEPIIIRREGEGTLAHHYRGILEKVEA